MTLIRCAAVFLAAASILCIVLMFIVASFAALHHNRNQDLF